MATQSSIPAWQTPGKKSLQERGACRLQPMGLQRVGHDWSNLAHSTRSGRVQTESRWPPPLCAHNSRTWRFTHVGASGLHQEGRQCVPTLPRHTWRSYSCHTVVSDSVRPHGQQPIRLLCPRDSPGKNTGVSCHFLLQCMLSHFSHVRLCETPWTAAHQAPVSTGFSRQEYWTGLPFPTPSLRSLECHNPIVFETRSTRK